MRVASITCCFILLLFTKKLIADFIVPIKANESGNKYVLLPSRLACGYQHSDDYFRPTNATSINEFPWIARIQYKSKFTKQKLFQCSGSLINNRYVLTAAHCTSPSYTIESVRLGEYDAQNETDCVNEDPYYTECSEPVEDVAVEAVISHSGYRSGAINDIALLRLKTKILYSDYIRPICLPLSGDKLSKPGDTLITSGWGGGSEEALIKKKVFSKLISNDDCTKVYRRLGFNATEKHICTRIDNNNTDLECNGDGGGPVMSVIRSQWQQEGIISAGKASKCAHSDYPEIHTKVDQYIDWIVENIKP